LSPNKVKVINKVAKVKMILRGLDVDNLVVDEPLAPPKVAEVIQVVATTVPEPDSLTCDDFRCTEIICSCWGDCSISVGNVCRLCSATKYSSFEKLNMHGGVHLPKVDLKVKARQAARVNKLAKAEAAKAAKAARAVKAEAAKAAKAARAVKAEAAKAAKAAKAEAAKAKAKAKPVKLASMTPKTPVGWDYELILDKMFPEGFFTANEIDDIFADF
jgi:hypothetical protein